MTPFPKLLTAYPLDLVGFQMSPCAQGEQRLTMGFPAPLEGTEIRKRCHVFGLLYMMILMTSNRYTGKPQFLLDRDEYYYMRCSPLSRRSDCHKWLARLVRHMYG